MKKLLVFFLTFSSAINLYSMDQSPLSLFQEGTWSVIKYSNSPDSGTIYIDAIAGQKTKQVENTDSKTKTLHPYFLDMHLYSKGQTPDNTVKIKSSIQCKFLLYSNMVQPSPLNYMDPCCSSRLNNYVPALYLDVKNDNAYKHLKICRQKDLVEIDQEQDPEKDHHIKTTQVATLNFMA